MPEENREALRNCGGLPDAWLTSFDANGFLDVPADGRPAVLFWPHQIKYEVPSGSSNGEKPFDVIAYLGERPAAEQSEKQLHEREVFSAFCNTVAVHIVFLKAETEGDVTKYLHLHSFGELAKWGRSFKEALGARFHDRPMAAHVLVVVIEGEQVKTSDEELQSFNSMLEDSGFACCYILDNNLGLGASGKAFHSSDVWPIMLERLLLYFVLAEETGSLAIEPTCMIKIWQAFECRIPCTIVKSGESNDQMDDVRGIIESAGGSSSDSDLLRLNDLPSLTREEIKPCSHHEKLSVWAGWSDYPVEKLGEECVAWQRSDLEKWGKVRECVQSIRDIISKCRRSMSGWLGNRVHVSPAVKSHIDELTRAIDVEHDGIVKGQTGEGRADKGENASRSSVAELLKLMLEKDDERQRALHSLQVQRDLNERDSQRSYGETLAESVLKAKNHYVGLGRAAVWLGLTVAMAGWVIWRVVDVLGGTPVFALTLSLAFASGGFAMMSFMRTCQRFAGDKAVKLLIAAADEADKAFSEKDMAARELVFNAQSRHCHLVRLGMLAQVKKQLERVLEVIREELKRAVTARERQENDDPGHVNGLMQVFNEKTITLFDNLWLKDGDVAEKANRPSFQDRFVEEWKKCCKEDSVSIDGGQFHNGYFPAAFYYREIRKFLIEFQKNRKREILQDAINHSAADTENKSNDILAQLTKWCKLRHTEANSEFASADLGKDNSLWSQTIQRFFVPEDSVKSTQQGGGSNDVWKTGVEQELDRRTGNIEEKYDVKTSGFIDESKTFALFYRELAVVLKCDEGNGVLSFGRKDDEA